MRRLVPLLVAGLLAFTGVAAPSPIASAAAAASGPKIVLIVGATHAATDSYRADMDAVYATAIQYSSNVVKVYSPNATWAAAKAALQGANIVVYMGHGNGFPSPYTTTLMPDRQDGLGLKTWDVRDDRVTTVRTLSGELSDAWLRVSADGDRVLVFNNISLVDDVLSATPTGWSTIATVPKDTTTYPELTSDIRSAMTAEAERFEAE